MLVFISTLILGIIAVGWKFKRRPEIHMPCMLLAFAMDIGLVLYIEWSRHAIEEVGASLSEPTSHTLLLVHVGFSLLTLLLYLVQIVTGIMLFRGNLFRRVLHRRCAYAFLACRLANYVTSLMVGG